MTLHPDPWIDVGKGLWHNLPVRRPSKASSTLEFLEHNYRLGEHSCAWSGRPGPEPKYIWKRPTGPESESTKTMLRRWNAFRPEKESSGSAKRRGSIELEDKVDIWERYHGEILERISPLDKTCIFCEWDHEAVVAIVEHAFAKLGNPMVAAKELFSLNVDLFIPLDQGQVVKHFWETFGWAKHIVDLQADQYVDYMAMWRKSALQTLQGGQIRLKDGSVKEVKSVGDLRNVTPLPVKVFEKEMRYPLAKLGDDLIRRNSPSKKRFIEEIQSRKRIARYHNEQYVEINAAELHWHLGGYPGPGDNMKGCCDAMREEWTRGDRVIEGSGLESDQNFTVSFST